MTSGQQEYNHICNVWLDSPDQTSPILLALRHGNCTNMRRLDGLVRTPGEIDSLRYIDPGDNTEKELEEEQKEEIAATIFYMNWIRNEYGIVDTHDLDITKYGRENFLDFVTSIFLADGGNHIKFDHAKATQSKREQLEKDRAAEEHKMKKDLLQAQLAAATAITMSGAGSSNTNTTAPTTTTTPGTKGGNTRNPLDPFLQKLQALVKSAGKYDEDQYTEITQDVDFASSSVQTKIQATLHGMETY